MVDFRDRDSISTGFEYDVYPFIDGNPDGSGPADDGYPWDVDDDVGTTAGDATFPDAIAIDPLDRGVVWGVERPELLITETIAWHDRKTSDTTSDSTSKKIMDGDGHFDQVVRPVGSFFVELYAPWNVAAPPAPELYKLATDPWNPAAQIWQLDSRERLWVVIPFGVWPWSMAELSRCPARGDAARRDRNQHRDQSGRVLCPRRGFVSDNGLQKTLPSTRSRWTCSLTPVAS